LDGFAQHLGKTTIGATMDHLGLKIRQMHLALGSLESDPSVKAIMISNSELDALILGFNRSDPIALANRASLLVASIASIKDHLKVWCRDHGVAFRGEALINGNADVAIVHDLWNIDKHAELDREPRSGYKPRLEGLRTSLVMRTAANPGARVMAHVDKTTGQLITQADHGGSASLRLVADVVDESGARLGDFADICARAVDGWRAELLAAGVQLEA
jgi:hypothetical protein